MKPGVYKHVRCTDVALEVNKVTRRSDGYSVVCRWLNVVNPNNVFRMDPDLHVEFITDTELPNWRPYDAKL